MHKTRPLKRNAANLEVHAMGGTPPSLRRLPQAKHPVENNEAHAE
jgi:hypothetical protein